MEWVKAADLDAIGDLAAVEPEGDELPPGDRAELAGSDAGDDKVDWALSFRHILNKGAHPILRPRRT